MNASQHARFEMARAVRAHLTQHATLTNGIVGYPAAFQSFCDGLDAAENLAVKQEQLATSAIVARNLDLDTMIDSILALVGAVVAVTDPVAQRALHTTIRIGRNDFRRSRLSHRVRQAQFVCDAIRDALPTLTPLGITEETVANLQGKIDAAAEALPTPRAQVIERKVATAEIASWLSQLDEILTGQLDPMLHPLRTTHREFYNGYKAARMVLYRSSSRPGDGATSGGTLPLAAPAASAAPVAPLQRAA